MQILNKHIQTFICLVICMLIKYDAAAQEVCNNGIDDDDDGLIDLYDPDCQCRFKVTDNLLVNGSFESYDHCPLTYLYQNDFKIADYWQYGTYTNVNEAYYYHNFNCVYDSTQFMLNMPPKLPLPQGDAFISVENTAYNNPVPEAETNKSYVGQCLQNPLQTGESYTLSFYAGRFRSWDNLTGKIFPFTVAVFGNADCKAVPFGKTYAKGNGCPANYNGWVLLGKTVVYSSGAWVQSKVTLTIPYDIHVIEIGPDCSILSQINDFPDNTTYLDYHVYYLDDLYLLPTKEFPFKYIHPQTESSCTVYPLLIAPVANAKYQWYRDSIAIKGATDSVYQVTDTKESSYYNVAMSTDTNCIISEPFLVTASNLEKIKIPGDTVLCPDNVLILSPSFEGITYTVNGITSSTVTINKEGNYTITATDAFGCSRTFNSNVAKQNCTDCDAYIPTAFTPNADGLNDIFKLKIECSFSEYHCRIFNRWGQKIFESADINKGWDGMFAGKKLPTGSYIYLVDYKTTSGNTKTARGTLLLIM